MSDDLRQRQQLLKIGTARAAQPPAGLGAPLDTLLPAAHADRPEAALWQSIGALDLWERSGFLAPPAAAAPASAPAPVEHLRACPPRADAVLARLLAGRLPAGLQVEWLRLLRRHGGRLPPRFLPPLLDAATRQDTLRPDLLPVLGERGRWLARLQPQWSWAAGADDAEAAWDTGTPEQRVAALQAWRARDPQAARAALEASWPSEPPERRPALLAALVTRLGSDDEAFLEQALDDRRKEVRTVAQRLLARLPGSQLRQRMLARLQPLLRLDGSRLELTLPEACDAPMRRDGVGLAAHPGLGEKAGWVVDMLAAVDPDTWTARFSLAPQACLALAAGSEFAAVLVRGWSLAALRQVESATLPGVPAWASAIMPWWIGAGRMARDAMPDAVPDALSDALAARLHEDAALAEAMLDALPAGWAGDHALVALLHRCVANAADAWAPGPTLRMMRQMRDARAQLDAAGGPWLARQLLPAFARAADPATAAGFELAWRAEAGADGYWRAVLDPFFDLVRQRHEMILSFQESA